MTGTAGTLAGPRIRRWRCPALLERREYKYLVPTDLLPAMRARLAAVGSLDPYARGGPYEVHSLYLDTAGLQLRDDVLRERRERYKVRVRGYGGKGPAFLEVKHRLDDVSRKTRTRVDGDWRARLPLDEPTDDRWLEHFRVLVHSRDLRPTLLVSYQREAWQSDIDPYARVSFDFAVVAQPCTAWSLEGAPSRWRVVDHPVRTRTPDARVVVELKFSGAPPRWMHLMVSALELRRCQFSKYVYGVEAVTPVPMTGRRVAGGEVRWMP